jgi:hypothetical protein
MLYSAPGIVFQYGLTAHLQEFNSLLGALVDYISMEQGMARRFRLHIGWFVPSLYRFDIHSSGVRFRIKINNKCKLGFVFVKRLGSDIDLPRRFRFLRVVALCEDFHRTQSAK